jgi:hypothetical protein
MAAKGKKAAAKSKVATDHREIQEWVESRGGRPARVKGTGGDDDTGLLRIDFPGKGRDESLEEISWDEFFDELEKKNLAFLYQDQTAEGKESRFSKLVNREGKE